jgi:Tol biopolymer transport system component
LLAVPFDVDRLEVTGSPVPLLEGVQVIRDDFAQFTFASDGSLVFLPGGVPAERRLVWVDRQGRFEPLAAPPRNYLPPRISPDGRQLAVTIAEDSTDVWVYDMIRHTLTRLTFEGINNLPLWTPDGKRVTFSSTRAGSTNLFWKPADGSGAAERLTTSEYTQIPQSWSPDGQVLGFHELHPITNWDIWVLPLEGERKPRPFLQTPFYESSPKFSPNGRWLAYSSNESGRFEVYVQAFPGPGGKWQISIEGGVEPVWARNGEELFYRNGDRMMAVDITADPTFSAGTPSLLFEGPYQLSGGTRPNYDVTPDGQHFLMVNLSEQESPVTRLTVVLNWFEELKERVPVP